MNHPICAVITAPGSAAIAVIRISGTGTLGIVAEFFRPSSKLLQAKSHQAVFGTFYNLDQEPLDQVLCTVFLAPHSYTGDETVELSCHGNPDLTGRILATLLSKAELAKPGEFTLRAYLNGKLDLVQAEAVNDLISAPTSKSESAALMQLTGHLSRHLEGLLTQIRDARLRCELAIDFSDQDLPQIDLDHLGSIIKKLITSASDLYAEGQNSIKLREGIRICLAGAPNAGKSSLFNAFLKHNRAIVTPHPGTTRDYLEESFSLSGYPIVLYDTAGLRTTDNIIEQEGINRSAQLMRDSDLILYLYDDPAELKQVDPALKDKCIFVAAKADLRDADFQPTPGHIPCSVNTPDGLKALSAAIISRLSLPQQVLYRPLITNARHLAALKRALDALIQAEKLLSDQAGFEFIAFELITATNALEDILGVVSTDDLLGEIFSNFCIGK